MPGPLLCSRMWLTLCLGGGSGPACSGCEGKSVRGNSVGGRGDESNAPPAAGNAGLTLRVHAGASGEVRRCLADGIYKGRTGSAEPVVVTS